MSKNLDKFAANYQFQKIGIARDMVLGSIEKFKNRHKEQQFINSDEVNSLLRVIESELGLVKESIEKPFRS